MNGKGLDITEARTLTDIVYTPTIWPTVGTILLLLCLIGYSWRRRRVPGALPFLFGCLFVMLVAAGIMMTDLAVAPKTRLFWFRFQYTWWMPSATAITCFVLEYAWPGRWLTRRNLIVLSIFPVLGAFYFMTDGFFHLLKQNIQLGETITATYSPVTWIFTAYILLLTVINFIVFTWLFIRSPRHRWPVILMASGQVAARLVLLSSTPSLEARVFNIPLVALPYITYAIALFGFHIFDPISLARESAVEQLSVGMLVLDLEDQVISLNPAAERVLGLPGSRARGQYIQHVLPVDPGDLIGVREGSGMEISLPIAEHLKPGESRRDFTLTISKLNDFRRVQVGSLLMLQDVTEQKQAQAQILEQQRAMAIQDERERLAREMHDSLGQTLAATHLLARSAKTLLEQDKTAQAEKCLDQISDMTLAAEADVREYLLGARLTIAAGQRFFEILRQYLVYFSQQYGLHVRLSIPPHLESEGLGTTVEMQLLRIIQEALTNIRKHARAQSTQVIFTDSEHFVQIAISDDGQGFDPTAVAGQTQGFGLQSMRERVDALGGCLEITSRPSQGTQVLVQVKREADSREAVVR